MSAEETAPYGTGPAAAPAAPAPGSAPAKRAIFVRVGAELADGTRKRARLMLVQ